MNEIRNAMSAVIQAEAPMTVRQVFYQLTTRGLIAKTETEYKSTVCRLLSEMRREGELPYGWIADGTRWMRKPTTYSGVDAFLAGSWRNYRRALWDDQDAYVELWIEKEALAGVLYDVTAEWDVPLMVTRGYPSLSFLHEAAEAIELEDRPVHLYYFGDADPSGRDIPRFVEEAIGEMAPTADFELEIVAVTNDQIELWDLPTRPTKRTDTRAKDWEGGSVELDAIPAPRLRRLADHCIRRHVDEEALHVVREAEEAERKGLRLLADQAASK